MVDTLEGIVEGKSREEGGPSKSLEEYEREILNLKAELGRYKREIDNFRELAAHFMPRPEDIPRVKGYDIFGEVFPCADIVGGGDLLSFFDFDRMLERERKDISSKIREKIEETTKKGGIFFVDAAGHGLTDHLASVAAYSNFLGNITGEISQNGEITLDAFDNLNAAMNARFTSRVEESKSQRFMAVTYAEISDEGRVRYISAGNPTPILYSTKDNRIIELDKNQKKTGLPIGLAKGKSRVSWKEQDDGIDVDYEVNQIDLRDSGDSLLFFTDGLEEHGRYLGRGRSYVNEKLEKVLAGSRGLSSRELVSRVYGSMKDYATINDDVTLCVIKREE